MRAKSSYQSLGDDTHHGICQEVALDAHIHETGQGTGGTVGMQGTYYQVARDGSLYRNLCRLCVSDLTNHDDIRVLSQNRTQCRRKGKLCLDIGLYLIDSVDVRLNRVLDSDNVYIFFVQLTESRIQCGGLTTSRRSCNQNNSIRVL